MQITIIVTNIENDRKILIQIELERNLFKNSNNLVLHIKKWISKIITGISKTFFFKCIHVV